MRNHFPAKVFAVFFLVTVLGLPMGYTGIDRLKAEQFPPFMEGLYVISVLLPPPMWVIRFWNSGFGRFFIYTGFLLVPILSGWLIFIKNKPISGWITMSIWSILAGVFGVWIWIYAVLNT